MQLSVSVHAASGMLAVGYRESATLLPRDVRVLEFELGELVAAALASHLAAAAALGPVTAIDLDVLVEQAEHALAARTDREDRPHLAWGLPALAVSTPETAGPRRRPLRSRRAWPVPRRTGRR